MFRRIFWVAAFLFVAAVAPLSAAEDSSPADYAKFTAGVTAQKGLFTIWRKDGKVYLELAKEQLDTDFVQTAMPGNGLGGFGITVGLPYLQNPTARIIRFTRVDNKVDITWPNTSFIATNGTPAKLAVDSSFAPSVVATAPIAAADAASGRVVIDASFLLGDVLGVTDALRQAFETDKHPEQAYRLDGDRSFFGPTKAFPENVIIEADQTYASSQPPPVMDNVTDARALRIAIKYNLAQAPTLGTYTPRMADDRVGYFPNIQLSYDTDRVRERQVRTITRWNVARHPMVYYLSSTIPMQYRGTIRDALLTWNQAFARIGYPHAVEVRDQPNDPTWDADDIRYNTVRWLTQAYNGGYAEAMLVWDPRTGELMQTGIVIDADIMQFGYLEGSDWAGATRSHTAATAFAKREVEYATDARASAAFGLAALGAVGEISPGQIPEHYADDFLKSIVLHESGHNWGLQHNFIASEAFTGAQVRTRSFTEKYGLANTVMEYTPANIWPKGMSNGDYFQTVLGPYDYYVIKWGYAPISGATTMEQERPTLLKWASVWSNPWTRYSMDEDVEWNDGHAIDPRVNQFDLTSDNVGWCEAQMKIRDTVLRNLPTRFKQFGDTHDQLRQVFAYTMFPLGSCTNVAWHYVGGELLSHAHIGDPNSTPPLVAISRTQSQRAFAFLDAHVFSAGAWNNISPSLLRQMVYSEWAGISGAAWAYNPPVRHDVPLGTIVEGLQQRTLDRMFNPVLLERVDEFSLKYAHGSTMTLGDMFGWTQKSVFGDLRRGYNGDGGAIRRSLQQWYARKLGQMLLAPAAGTPYDAQSLARQELTSLRGDVKTAQANAKLDDMTRAHLTALDAIADQALSARTVIPVTPDAGNGG